MVQLGGDLLPGALTQAASINGIDISVAIASSTALGTQHNEILGDPLFNQPLALPKASNAVVR